MGFGLDRLWIGTLGVGVSRVHGVGLNLGTAEEYIKKTVGGVLGCRVWDVNGLVGWIVFGFEIQSGVQGVGQKLGTTEECKSIQRCVRC